MRRPIDTVIDPELCIGCEECVRVCPTEAITMEDDVAVVSGEWSLGCGHCQAACPTDAVSVASVDDRALAFETIGPTDEIMEPGGIDPALVIRLMRSRRSCRNYMDREVPRPMLEDLVRIGITAPSGTNCQRWTFTVIPDRPAVLQLAETVKGFFERLNRKAESRALRLLARLLAGDALGRYYRDHYDSVEEGLRQWREEGRERLFHGAPAVIVVGAAPGASCPAEDALLATQNILLGAHAMGLGTCLVGFVVEAMRRDASVRESIRLPLGERVHTVIAVGWPDETYSKPAGRNRVDPRYPFDRAAT